MNTLDCSIIIATYKRPEILERTLTGIKNLDPHDRRFEVIVVDNGCDDATEQTVDLFRDTLSIKCIQQPVKGKNNAVNKGIELAKGEIIIYMDDDAIPFPDWLTEIMTGIDRWPEYHIFGCRILPLWPDEQRPEWVFSVYFFNPAFAVADWDLPEGPYDPGLVWGPTMIFRREVFDKGHRFTTKIGPKGNKNFVIGDEVEFTKRMSKCGYKSVFLPNVRVQHQIRPEQLTFKWLCHRAFIIGRTEAYEEESPEASFVFGVPKYLLRLLLKLSFTRMRSYLSFNRNFRMNAAIEFWHIYGKIYQYRNAHVTG